MPIQHRKAANGTFGITISFPDGPFKNYPTIEQENAMTNLLENPGFNEPSLVPSTLSGGPPNGTSGVAAAPKWSVWNTTGPLTTTDMLPSTRAKGAETMLHVCTLGSHNGIYQAFADKDAGPTRTRSGAWVFVLRGTVGIGTGNSGDTSDLDKQSTTHGKWEHLAAPSGGAPANEFIVYATSADGACFYVDDATVLPE